MRYIGIIRRRHDMTDDLICTLAAPSPSQISPRAMESGPNAGSRAATPPLKTVLLVEDNEIDVFMMKHACERSGIPHQLQIVTDGEMAMDYLSGNNSYSDRVAHPMPDLIFLDINLPRHGGFDVLKVIRAKPAFKKLPVIMLSGSTQMDDVDRAFQFGVTSYMRKIPNQAEYEQTLRVILNFWLHVGEPSS
jgi:CheY-like chemotaxis protein